MIYKQILSALAILLTIAAFVPYVFTIVRGSIRPHVFSWLIWGLTTFVVFLAQLAGNGGVGAWPIGISGLITLFIAALAYIKRGDITIHKADWLFLLLALSALPLWYLTAEPLFAVFVLTTADLLGFGPTIRKAYHHPFSESQVFFSLTALRNFLVILALETHSLTTVLFPAAIGVACIATLIVTVLRRYQIPAVKTDTSSSLP